MENLIETVVALVAALETFRGGKWAHKKLFIDRVPKADAEFWENCCKQANDARHESNKWRDRRIAELESYAETLKTDVDKWRGIAEAYQLDNLKNSSHDKSKS